MDGIRHFFSKERNIKNESTKEDSVIKTDIEDSIFEQEIGLNNETWRDGEDNVENELLNLSDLKKETTINQGAKVIFKDNVELSDEAWCFPGKEDDKQNELLHLTDIEEVMVKKEVDDNIFEVPNLNTETKTKFKCDICHITVTHKSYLENYSRTCTEEKQLKCETCEQRFSQNTQSSQEIGDIVIETHNEQNPLNQRHTVSVRVDNKDVLKKARQQRYRERHREEKRKGEQHISTEHITEVTPDDQLSGNCSKLEQQQILNSRKINSVAILVDNGFSRLTYNEKIAVKNLKRPMPMLNLENKQSVKGKGIVRKFKLDIYQKNDWICGCDVKNALFCFPCLLFGGEPSWSKNGIRDLVHLSAKISKHENSEGHLNNAFDLRMLGKNIQNVLDSSYRRAVQNHNEEVTKNRHVLNLIINCIRFCGAFELALRSPNERQTSNSKGIFRELINFTGELDKSLRDHIEAAPVFKGLSKTIQNELLDAMLNVYHEQVVNEIRTTDYVAVIISVIADETTDVSNQFQLVFVLRYIVNGRPVERFWKFLQPSGHDATSLSACILNEMNLLINDPKKLIAQSYDGTAVMSGAINGVQGHVQDQYPMANFVHCYSHQTNLIMSQATSSNSNCKIFFANLTGLCTFFSTSPQRAARLEEFLHKKGLSRTSKIKWNFNSKMVNTVYIHREELIEALEEIEREANLQTTIQQAGAHLRILEDENFIYWLTFFHKIMPHVDILFNKLQKATTNALKIKNNLDDFERAIKKIRTEIADTDNQFVEQNDSELNPRPSKRRRVNGSERRREAIEVCDIILLEIKTRFQFTGHLILSNLVSFKQFSSFEKRFPEDCLKEAVKFYPCLNESRLRIELSVLYSREEFRQNSETSAVGLLGLLLDGLSNTFYEVIKLLKIIITIPMTTSETERQFSQLKRIKTFLRNTMKEDRLNALTMLSCEKEFINDFQNFNEKVIELFCKSNPGFNFSVAAL